jgi:uncharacterized damage-inducible protein DinB
MPGNAPSTNTETEALLAYLVQQRDGLKHAAYGLTEDQLRAKPTRSALSVGGLMKHGALTERSWIALLSGSAGMGEADYGDTFQLTDGDTVQSLQVLLDEVGQHTATVVAELESLDERVQLPPAPWFPSSPDGYQARWILLHVIEELARHAGHADIIREHIDGATMYALMAGAEGWPETDWLKPWRPSVAGEPV